MQDQSRVAGRKNCVVERRRFAFSPERGAYNSLGQRPRITKVRIGGLGAL